MSLNQYKLQKYLRKYKETNKMKYLDKVMYYLKVGGGSGSKKDEDCKIHNDCDPTNCIRYEFGEADVCRGNDVTQTDAYTEWMNEQKEKRKNKGVTKKNK
jgi:hypothetical protein